MVTHLEVELAEIHRKKRLHDAEQWRLARQALDGQDSGQSYRVRVLRWTGDRLVGAGMYLQNRFGECVECAKEASSYQPVDSMPTAW